MLKSKSTFQCWLVAHCILLLISVATAAPIQVTINDNDNRQLTNEQLAHYFDDSDLDTELVDMSSGPDFAVDVRQFANLLSTHLVYDHLESAFFTVVKKISRRFRDMIQVDTKFVKDAMSKGSSDVDVYILKDQLKGAVGSFIEDRLPIVWNKHASELDRRSLQAYITHVVRYLCPEYPAKDFDDDDEPAVVNAVDDHRFTQHARSATTLTVSNVCLERRSRQFLSSVDRYVGTHIQRIMAEIMWKELPTLFETAQAQVKDILVHFNTNVLNLDDSRVELVLASEPFSSNRKMDYAWMSSPTEMNEILDIVSHWDSPMDEGSTDGQDGAQLRQSRKQRILAVHHFTALARVA